jgi:hypothetical protein
MLVIIEQYEHLNENKKSPQNKISYTQETNIFMNNNNKKLVIHLVSDSTGETLRSVGAAAAAQFNEFQYEENVYSLIRSQKNLERVFGKIKTNPGIVLCTLIDDEIRKQLEFFCKENDLSYLPFMDNIISLIESETGVKAIKQPGTQHQLDEEYFRRIEALNYTIEHDDGQNIETIEAADIVLVGVSRTSKTPTCIYLANQGIKAANVPLVPGQGLQKEVEKLNKPLVVALITTPKNLVEIRTKRSIELGLDLKNDKYTKLEDVIKEIEAAKKTFISMGWPIIDTTRRSIEETSAAIMNIRMQK